MGNEPMCSCNHPRWEKSMEDESRAKFYKSRSRNNMKQKKPKSEIDVLVSIENIKSRRMELKCKLDKERKEYDMMKRAYISIKTETDNNLYNQEKVGKLEKERNEYHKQLIKDKEKSKRLSKEINEYKEQIKNMQYQINEMS